VTHAKVVECEPHALGIERREDRVELGRVLHRLGLREFEFETLRRQPVLLERGHDFRDEVGLGQLQGGDVDRDALELGASGTPLGQRGARGLEHPAADLADDAGLLGECHELARREQATRRVLPAQQRLCGGRLARGRVHDGLEVEDELVALERHDQVVLQHEAVEQLFVHGCRVPAESPAARALGGIHRAISPGEDVFGTLARFAGHYSDARCHAQLVAFESQRLGEVIEKPARDVLNLVDAASIGNDDDELVAAHSAHEVGVAQDLGEPLTNKSDEPVAGFVAQRVVDGLEVVDVEVDRGEARAVALEVLE